MVAVNDTPSPEYYEPPDYDWEGGDPDSDEDYLECALCTHSMNDECGIGEYDYFGPGQHICSCCAQDEPDPNEVQG